VTFAVFRDFTNVIEAMEETLRLLEHSLHGEQASTDRLMEILGGELRSIAEAQLRKERPGHTLQPTALVNEAYLRLIGQTEVAWQNASHFRAIASSLMRRILIDHARRRASGKRGGSYERVWLTAAAINDRDDHVELLVVNDLLETMETLNPRHAKIAEHRIFGGWTHVEIANALSLSLATVKKDWRFTKVWLASQMQSELSHGNHECR